MIAFSITSKISEQRKCKETLGNCKETAKKPQRTGKQTAKRLIKKHKEIAKRLQRKKEILELWLYDSINLGPWDSITFYLRGFFYV